MTLSKNGTKPTRDAISSLRPLFDEARKVAINEKASLVNRQHAILLLGHGFDQREKDIEILTELMSPRQSQPLQRSVLRALARFSDRKVGESLLARWKTFGPQLRTDLLDLLLRRQAWLEQLLDAIEQNKIRASHIDATRRQMLLFHKNQKIRQRAIKLFASTGETDRTKVIKRYANALTLKGDKTKGHQLFKKRCSVCHRLNNEGYAIGPDLSALTDKSPKALLVSILDPNRAIEQKFVSYVASTLGGLTFTGMLATESGNSITLLQNEGKKQTLLRSEIDEFQSTNKSLMPEGLEKDISKQGIADIIAYLNGTVPPRKKFTGNNPVDVKPEALRGDYWLIPQNAEVYGKTIVYEPRYKNLGFWQSENDHVAWTLNVTKAGRFDIYVEYACPQSSAENMAALEVAGERMTWQVKSTTSWNNYASKKVGSINLKPGKIRLGVRSVGSIKNALFDLKTVRLQPYLHQP